MLHARLGYTLTISGIAHIFITSFILSRSWVWLLYRLHDHVSELPVHSTLIRLSEKITHHVTGWTLVHRHFFLLDSVCNKKN